MGSEPTEPPSVGEQILASMQEFVDALRSGQPLEQRLTVRTLRLDLTPGVYDAGVVKQLRHDLGLPRPFFAKFLGVSTKTLRGWEDGTRPVPAIARRFMDEVRADPKLVACRIGTTRAGHEVNAPQPAATR